MNIVAVRDIYEAIHTLNGIDAVQYEEEHKLKITRIYNMIPSMMCHRALNAFLANPDYHVHDAYVLSNERLIKKDRFITYLPIYFAPFIRSNHPDVVTL